MQLTVWKPIIWIDLLLYWNSWNKDQLTAKYMQFSLRKFRFIFSLHHYENTQNVHFREAKFSGGACPQTRLVYSHLLALKTIFARLILNCFRQHCYYHWVILSIILRILCTQKDVSFLSRKRCTFCIIQIYVFQVLLTWGPLKLKVHPPPPAEKVAYTPGYC